MRISKIYENQVKQEVHFLSMEKIKNPLNYQTQAT